MRSFHSRLKTLSLLVSFFIFGSISAFNQESIVDSLLSTLPSQKDSNYIKQLQLIYHDFPDWDSKVKYAQLSLDLSNSVDYQPGILEAYYSLAEFERRKNNHKEALGHLGEAEKIGIELKDQSMLFRINKKKAYSLRQLGNPKEALSYLLEASSIATSLKDSTFLADIYFEIGDFHRVQKYNDLAIEYFEKAMLIQEQLPRSWRYCRLFFNMSITYKNFDDKERQEYGIRLLEELKTDECYLDASKGNKARLLNNLGSAYVKIGKLKKGEEVLLEALAAKKQLDDSTSLAYTLNELASLYSDLEEYEKALQYAEKARSTVPIGADVFLEKDILNNLSHISYNIGDYKYGFNQLLKLQDLKDSILTEEKALALAEMSSKFELEKKEKDLIQKDLMILQQENKYSRSLIIGLLVLAVVIGLFLWARWKLSKQKLEAEKFQELDKLKSGFFTNITHEFRTPLTVILNSISGNKDDAGTTYLDSRSTNVVERNARRLENLINQLLDLSKLEAGKMRLQVSEQNLTSFLKSLTQSFHSFAAQKDIQLKFMSRINGLKVYFDEDKLDKILSNLINNAVKFTPENGEVNVLLLEKDGLAEITVNDTGIGIPSTALDHIFNRFHQIDNSETRNYEGTGIGLALAEQMVKVHRGTIEVESVVNQGSTFIVRIPIDKSSYTSHEIRELTDSPSQKMLQQKPIPIILNSMSETDNSQTNTNLPILLIIEDDQDLRFLLRKQLEANYQIIEAQNGEEGIQKAIEQVPDIIISDVMMPVKSGFEVAKMIKKDDRTSHIPIVLLTAKATTGEKVEGLETGADSYLVKPFNKKELEVTISNLITQRQLLQQRFAKEVVYKTSETPAVSREDVFLQKLLGTIESQIADEGFGVESLAGAMHMSRSQLYRKVKALTGKTPNSFLRDIRLERAKDLLHQEVGNVSEIAMMVGFSNTNYFYKCFKETYGITPGEILRSEN